MAGKRYSDVMYVSVLQAITGRDGPRGWLASFRANFAIPSDGTNPAIMDLHKASLLELQPATLPSEVVVFEAIHDYFLKPRWRRSRLFVSTVMALLKLS